MSMAAVFFTALSGGVALNATLMKPSEVRPGVWRTMGALSGVTAALALALTFLLGSEEGAAAAPSQGLMAGVLGVAIVGAAGALVRPGRVAQLALAGCALAAAVALVLPLLSQSTDGLGVGTVLVQVLAAVTAMAVLGAALASMILGHWYLVGDGMPLEPFRRLAAAYGIAVALRIITLVVGLLMLPGLGELFGSAESFLRGGGVGLTAVLAFGLVLPPILALGARATLRVPNTQSATGILYVACIAAIICDLSARGAGL